MSIKPSRHNHSVEGQEAIIYLDTYTRRTLYTYRPLPACCFTLCRMPLFYKNIEKYTVFEWKCMLSPQPACHGARARACACVCVWMRV